MRIRYPRHSYASRALALGENLAMIGKLLGHTRVQTNARYKHLARDSNQNAAALITGSIGGDRTSYHGQLSLRAKRTGPAWTAGGRRSIDLRS